MVLGFISKNISGQIPIFMILSENFNKVTTSQLRVVTWILKFGQING